MNSGARHRYDNPPRARSNNIDELNFSKAAPAGMLKASRSTVRLHNSVTSLETVANLAIPVRTVESKRAELAVFIANIESVRVLVRIGIEDVLRTDSQG